MATDNFGGLPIARLLMVIGSLAPLFVLWAIRGAPEFPDCYWVAAYGHHHPDYMRGAAAAITMKQPANISGQGANVSLVVSLVEPENARPKRQKS